MARSLSRGRVAFYIVIILCAPLIIYGFGARHLRFFFVPSDSMKPTLQRGDYLATVNEAEYRRGDIVVLNDPEHLGEYIVKRIAAVGNDRVMITEGGLFLNGLYASEPYVPEPMAYEMSEIVVPEREYFVLGDNRNNSEDSSSWDPAKGVSKTVPYREIVGKVFWRYFPWGRIGSAPGYPLVNSAGQ